MHIFDNEGNQLTITNLEAAIEQAQSLADFRHVDPAFEELDETLNAYWNDILTKLKNFKPVIN